MKAILAPILLAATLAFTGCETMSDMTESVREKVAARSAPHSRVFSAEQRTAYAAARAATEAMGFRFLRGGPAQGEIDAVSGLSSDNALRSTRQVSMKIRLVTVPGGTDVRVALTEIVEQDSSKSAGRAIESPLRESPLYSVFYRQVEQSLGAPQK